jgi:hypothetical protein
MPFFDLNTGIMKGLTSTGANCNATLPLGPTTPNSVPQILTSTPSGGVAGTATWGLAGVPANAQTGTTYTILATDRASYISFNNAGAIAVTLPDAGSTNFAANYTFVACDLGAGTATISRTSTSTISYTNGSTFTNVATTLALTTGQCAWFYSDNTNWFAIVRSGGGGISGLTTSKIPKAASSTTLADSALDDGLTTATFLTYSGAGGIVASGTTGNVIANGGLFAGANAALTAITAAITPGGNVQMGSTGVLGIANGGNLSSSSIDTGQSRIAQGVWGFGNQTQGDESALIRSGMPCRITTAVTLSTSATNICSWSLPAVAKTWAWRCDVRWAVTAGTTPTISFGMNASQTPTSETGSGSILTTNTGTSTQSSATSTSSGSQNIITSPTLTTSATLFQASTFGTVQASATAGTFALNATGAGASFAGTIGVGSVCTLQ